MAANKDNPDESFWQETLTKYSFVFSQVFSSPVVLFESKAFYVGGKNVGGTGGKEPDFLLKNELTSHLLIVEIKTPATELLSKTPYRPPNVRRATRTRRVGDAGVAPVHKGTRSYKTTGTCGWRRRSRSASWTLPGRREHGRTRHRGEAGVVRAFPALRGTEIITFDELFRKVEICCTFWKGRCRRDRSDGRALQGRHHRRCAEALPGKQAHCRSAPASEVDAAGWKDAIVKRERPSGPQALHGHPADAS